MSPVEILTLAPLGALVVIFGLQPGSPPQPLPEHRDRDAGRRGAHRTDPGPEHRRHRGGPDRARPGPGAGRLGAPPPADGATRDRRRGGPLSWQDFVTISPLVAGILTAAAILVVDLIRPGKPAVAVATALIGLGITGRADARGRRDRRDGLRWQLPGRLADPLPRRAVRGDHRDDHLFGAGLPHAAGSAGGRVRGDPRVRDDRHDADRGIGRPAPAVPRPRAHGPAGLPAGRLPQDRLVLDRGRDQVLPARLVQLGHLPVRDRVHLGPDRHDAPGRHRRRAGRDRGRDRAAVARPGDGPRVPDDRRRVQDRGGAVPLLDAGRVPGLPDADHGLPVGRSQGRRLRADPAPVRGGARAAGRLVDAGRHRPGHDHDDARQPRRADPGQRQADAGVQLHRPHRLHAGRAGRLGEGPGGSSGSRRSCSTGSPTRS